MEKRCQNSHAGEHQCADGSTKRQEPTGTRGMYVCMHVMYVHVGLLRGKNLQGKVVCMYDIVCTDVCMCTSAETG